MFALIAGIVAGCLLAVVFAVACRGWLSDMNRIREIGRDEPLATFFDPVEYPTAEEMEVRKAVREFSETIRERFDDSGMYP